MKALYFLILSVSVIVSFGECPYFISNIISLIVAIFCGNKLHFFDD